VNTYGSELLAIRVPLRAESYTGTGWSLHAADSCTAIPTNAIAITNSGALAPVIQSPSPITLNGGLGTLVFNATAAAGSFDLAANLNAAGVDTSCNPAHGGAAANMPWLQGFWSSTCNGTPAWAQDPNARIRAGSPKAPYIYLRERY
jgi:MSHA biogenesis protein MshQ